MLHVQGIISEPSLFMQGIEVPFPAQVQILDEDLQQPALDNADLLPSLIMQGIEVPFLAQVQVCGVSSSSEGGDAAIGLDDVGTESSTAAILPPVAGSHAAATPGSSEITEQGRKRKRSKSNQAGTFAVIPSIHSEASQIPEQRVDVHYNNAVFVFSDLDRVQAEYTESLGKMPWRLWSGEVGKKKSKQNSFIFNSIILLTLIILLHMKPHKGKVPIIIFI